jgi:hypothetical protein
MTRGGPLPQGRKWDWQLLTVNNQLVKNVTQVTKKKSSESCKPFLKGLSTLSLPCVIHVQSNTDCPQNMFSVSKCYIIEWNKTENDNIHIEFVLVKFTYASLVIWSMSKWYSVLVQTLHFSEAATTGTIYLDMLKVFVFQISKKVKLKFSNILAAL